MNLSARAAVTGAIRLNTSTIRLRDRIGIEADALQLRDFRRQLPLEPLRPGTDPREVDRSAGGALLRSRLAEPAVVAAQDPALMQRKRDVALLAADRRSAGAAVERGREAA